MVIKRILTGGMVLLAGGLLHFLATAYQAGNANKPMSRLDNKQHQHLEHATFAAGCFWGVEDAFRQVKGVVATTVGYTGGTVINPTYYQVCTNTTGHAEAVWVEFDPDMVSYSQLLDVFWSIHDPTTLNRQGPDVGTQYRSVIFYHSPQQQAEAERSKKKLDASGRYRRPAVTQIVAAPEFYRAEEYHQQYHEKHGGSCLIQ